MKGKYEITVKNNVLRYRFEIRRNITVIQGNSATGKTTLIDMIREYYNNGQQSGVDLYCEKPCVVLEGRQWKTLLKEFHDSIVFIDEGNAFISSDEFAGAVRKSDNYFVIVTRESLPNLPYSIEEIYGIRDSGKYGTLKQTYQEFYRIYGDADYEVPFQPDIVLLEDSNSGFEFFEEIAKDKEWTAVSASGKSKVFKFINDNSQKRLLIIADGAAFGSEMDKVMKRIKSAGKTAIYLPESFEWLVLKSGILNDKNVEDVLANPYEYIESQKYMSWEQFFTAFLIEKTQDHYLKYSKNKLNEAYKGEKIQEKIMEVIPKNLF